MQRSSKVIWGSLEKDSSNLKIVVSQNMITFGVRMLNHMKNQNRLMMKGRHRKELKRLKVVSQNWVNRAIRQKRKNKWKNKWQKRKIHIPWRILNQIK